MLSEDLKKKDFFLWKILNNFVQFKKWKYWYILYLLGIFNIFNNILYENLCMEKVFMQKVLEINFHAN